MHAHLGLPPKAYYNPEILALERATLFRTHWQWAGLIDDVKKPGGLVTEIAGMPVIVEGEPGSLRVNMVTGHKAQPLDDAVADACGRFVFVRLTSDGPSLDEFLGEYVSLLKHCTDNFGEAYHVTSEDWKCNWKSGIEITLEGYHVPFVHAAVNEEKKKGSNFIKSVPYGENPHYHGPHSYQSGIMAGEMRLEMDNIAKRLKIAQSKQYTNYDHFTLFPNMTVGISGGNLCFMQIYTPLTPGHTRLRYAYIMAKLADPAKPPVALIKTTLLQKWRDYTTTVLHEDKRACERFQLGVPHAIKTGLIGSKIEERVAHFHHSWREAVGIKEAQMQTNSSRLAEMLDWMKALLPSKVAPIPVQESIRTQSCSR